eukprot:Gregarina_sp_Poly_1__2347@NODE_1628_length_3681_cov_42_123962_g1074_i0_p2_GENE_NODE_1628_length_3681_cov_42_123962_g1074_i0NODE_1628_length_3681_cov_42_123962_g1074_i0_p2_ORF_typecomplete_len146_score13_31_NODE_1628_length_3681_cov_42_123962_g1074_i028713308
MPIKIPSSTTSTASPIVSIASVFDPWDCYFGGPYVYQNGTLDNTEPLVMNIEYRGENEPMNLYVYFFNIVRCTVLTKYCAYFASDLSCAWLTSRPYPSQELELADKRGFAMLNKSTAFHVMNGSPTKRLTIFTEEGALKFVNTVF